jgi:hypothetical protein
MTGLVGGAAQARVVPTFRVPDIAAAVSAVRAAGGEAADSDADPYAGASCVDDQGAPFHLTPR